MAELTPLFFDTSVLLAGAIELGAASKAAQRLFGALADGQLERPRTAWHCCLEMYAVSTRLPEEWRLAPADAVRLIEEEILGRFDVLDLPAAERGGALHIAALELVAGGRIYDLHIAEIARRSGARVVVTENKRHFASLLRHDVRVLDAAEAVAAARL